MLLCVYIQYSEYSPSVDTSFRETTLRVLVPFTVRLIKIIYENHYR